MSNEDEAFFDAPLQEYRLPDSPYYMVKDSTNNILYHTRSFREAQKYATRLWNLSFPSLTVEKWHNENVVKVATISADFEEMRKGALQDYGWREEEEARKEEENNNVAENNN